MTDFDAAAIAADADHRGKDPLSAVVGQLAGYASTCWSNLPAAGLFESDRAKDAVDSTLDWLREQLGGAWGSGYASGWSNAARRFSDEPNAPITPNPYRAGQTS
jgi:hypothetical protein